jgi:hypothetical protein
MTERTRALLPLVQLRLTGRFNSITSSHRGESPMQRRFALTVNCLDKPGEIFPKLPGYETKHSTSTNYISTRLLCARFAHHVSLNSARCC